MSATITALSCIAHYGIIRKFEWIILCDMKVSNRVKRNISFVLVIVGMVCTVARIWDVITSPASGWAWFQLLGIIMLTYLCFDNFQMYRRRIKDLTSGR